MDTFVTRYTHMGVTYVHDAYTGSTMPADVYDAISSASVRSSGPAPVFPTTHPLLRKTVKFVWGSQIVTGRFTKMDAGRAVVKTATMTYFLDPASLEIA